MGFWERLLVGMYDELARRWRANSARRDAERGYHWSAACQYKDIGLKREACECYLKAIESSSDWPYAADAIRLFDELGDGVGIGRAVTAYLSRCSCAPTLPSNGILALRKYGKLRQFVDELNGPRFDAAFPEVFSVVADELRRSGELRLAVQVYILASSRASGLRDDSFRKVPLWHALDCCYEDRDRVKALEIAIELFRLDGLFIIHLEMLRRLGILEPLAEHTCDVNPDLLQDLLGRLLEWVDPCYEFGGFDAEALTRLGGPTDPFEQYEDVMDLALRTYEKSHDRPVYLLEQLLHWYGRIDKKEKMAEIEKMLDN
ncbi:hypothetical protein LCGC14_0016960 [marine sediment metagenome]|uniref:Uncharacterized protein n=1 Tax=marine sediment metagenome TaxID=412755 RepID=A0A0F9W4D0_9ZZZZ|nr:hypothetical protein [Phycisphaerae bacterium]HDZ42404.1 hypothetical protein [Phycisphaerae bacterium]